MSLTQRAGQAVRRATLALTLAALCVSVTGPLPVHAAGLNLALVQSGFTSPVFLTNAGDSRLFVVQQNGYVKIVGGGTFLDIHTKIVCCGEQGLLGLAFHPNYANNRLFYVYYTRASDGADVVEEYKRSTTNANLADPASGRLVIAIADPYSNHNAGWIAFRNGGPNLFIADGDGGSGGDPGNRAQSLNVLLGKILRINPLDPDGSGSRRYSIPDSNPFVGKAGRDEIYAYGLRNPWRCSWDRKTSYLWCGDVGQNLYEEIDRQTSGKGVNFGWRLLEGFHYYNYPNHTSGNLCTSACKTLPIAEYAHSAFGGGNCAVTGGYVARRDGTPLYGQYIFGDYCSGKVWSISAAFAAGSTLPAPIADTDYAISSFGEDNIGRLYLIDLNGSVYRLTDT
jgi:glucose/arabinose dehydrogenase